MTILYCVVSLVFCFTHLIGALGLSSLRDFEGLFELQFAENNV